MTNNTRLLNLTNDEILERFAKHLATIHRIEELIALYQRSIKDVDKQYSEAADNVITGRDESLQNRIDAAQFSQMYSDFQDFVMDLENVLDPPENEVANTTATVKAEVAA